MTKQFHKVDVFKPPMRVDLQDLDPRPSIFLAGSIEMGKAEDWQTQLTNLLTGVRVFNPRRDDWDPSWTQSITNPNFKEQVEWEHFLSNSIGHHRILLSAKYDVSNHSS